MNDMTPFQGVPNPIPENDGLDDAWFFRAVLPGGLARFESLTAYMRSMGWAITEIGSITIDYGTPTYAEDWGPDGGNVYAESVLIDRGTPSVKVTPKTHENIGDERRVMCRYGAYDPVFIGHIEDRQAHTWMIRITAGVIEKIPLVDIFKTLQKRDPVLWNLGL